MAVTMDLLGEERDQLEQSRRGQPATTKFYIAVEKKNRTRMIRVRASENASIFVEKN